MADDQHSRWTKALTTQKEVIMFRFTMLAKTMIAALTVGSGLLLAGCSTTDATPTPSLTPRPVQTV